MVCFKFNMLCRFLGVQYHVEEFRGAGPSLPTTAVGFGNFFETWDVEKGGSITKKPPVQKMRPESQNCWERIVGKHL